MYLGADRLGLCSRGVVHVRCNLAQVDSARQVHAARVDAQDVEPRVLVRVGELDLAVNAAGAEESGVENVDAVGGHDDFDLFWKIGKLG